MTLQEKIRDQLKQSMKEKNEVRTSVLRVLLGEFQRQPKKELNDAEVLSIIKKSIKAETEMLERKGDTGSDYLTILQEYMPQQAGEDEIRAWIMDNIDFSEFKNRMQAMKPIMAHFGGSVDGSTVKRIIMNYE